jgi:hypothetical protein
LAEGENLQPGIVAIVGDDVYFGSDRSVVKIARDGGAQTVVLQPPGPEVTLWDAAIDENANLLAADFAASPSEDPGHARRIVITSALDGSGAKTRIDDDGYADFQSLVVGPARFDVIDRSFDNNGGMHEGVLAISHDGGGAHKLRDTRDGLLAVCDSAAGLFVANTLERTIVRLPPDGGAERTIWKTRAYPKLEKALAIDSDYVYFAAGSEGFGEEPDASRAMRETITLARVPHGGGDPIVIARITEPDEDLLVGAIVVDATSVYVTLRDRLLRNQGGAVVRAAKDGSKVERILDQRANPGVLALANDWLAWTEIGDAKSDASDAGPRRPRALYVMATPK